MRKYGNLSTNFWSDDKIFSLSVEAKLLAAYLLTSSHSNAIGCYRLPDGYIQADLGWSIETVQETLSKLFDMGFLYRCHTTQYVLIKRFLRWNKPENPNVWRHVNKLFASIPSNFGYVSELLDILKPFGDRIETDTRNRLEALSKPIPNKEPEPEPEPNQNPTQTEPDICENSLTLVVEENPDDENRKAFDLYNETAEKVQLSKAQKFSDQRKAALKNRLKECGGIEGWRYALEKVEQSSFLTGSNKDGWKADLDFILTKSKFTKIMEGSYENNDPVRQENELMASFDRISNASEVF